MSENTKILIVDDEEISLRTSSTILKKKGYNVFTVNTAIGITDSIDACKPALIIMDHDMPQVSGAEAVIQLKADNKYKQIPIILFSSRYDIEQISATTGADAFLQKGIRHYDELIALIKSLTEPLS